MVTVRLVILLTIPIRANGEHVRPNSEDAQPHGPTMANVSHNGTYFENQHHPNGPMAQCHLVQVFAPAYAMAFFHAHNKRKANWT